MKTKISKCVSVIKRDGIFTFIKKIVKFIFVNYAHKLNIISFFDILINKKKYNKLIDEILNGSFDRIVLWRSSFGWNVPLFQRPQHIAREMSEQNCLFFYEVTKVTDNVDTIKKVKDNLYLLNFNNINFKNLLFKKLKEVQKPKYIQFYSTNWSMSESEELDYIKDGFKIIYEYIDDLSPKLAGTTELPKHIIDKYEYMLKDTDNVLLVVTADKLYDDVKEKRNFKNIAFACNGVDFDHFANTPDIPLKEDFAKVVSKSNPIIGYYGALASWFDYDLLKYLATQRPNYEIVLFGIKYDDEFDKHGLNNYSNIHFLGSVDYIELPAYASKFSVCTIPFLVNEITEATSPVKLFEYMAMAKPIVTTDMNECRKYKSVMIAKTKEEFISLIDKAISLNPEKDKEYFDTLKAEALENTWRGKAKEIIKLLQLNEV